MSKHVLIDDVDALDDEEAALAAAEEQRQLVRDAKRREYVIRQRKLMRSLRGRPVIFGLVIGVVIGQVDELENVTIAHAFSRKNAKARIRWARETNAKADAVNPFDATSNIDVESIPVPNSRKRTPEMERHERTIYKQQLQFALEFAEQWASRQVKLAELKKQQRALEAQLDDDEAGGQEG